MFEYDRFILTGLVLLPFFILPFLFFPDFPDFAPSLVTPDFTDLVEFDRFMSDGRFIEVERFMDTLDWERSNLLGLDGLISPSRFVGLDRFMDTLDWERTNLFEPERF